VLLALSLLFLAAASVEAAQQSSHDRRLRVFLDCSDCFADYLRTEVTFVDYVRDRQEADLHVLITRASTGSGGAEYTAEFMGSGTLAGLQRKLRAVTTTGDAEDTIRRQLANTLRLGLLNVLAEEGFPQRLSLDVAIDRQADPLTTAAQDPWDSWVFSIRGSGSIDGEESNRELQIGTELGADRITPDWKMTFGAELDFQRERFNINDEDEEPFEVERREREFNWLIVNGLGEHWSVGARGDIESSTFENTSLAISAAPAVEFNVFPYSAYTRRQLRLLYAVGPRSANYYEETLYGQTEETLLQHEISATFDQRERWGTLEARLEWSQYLHDLDLSRLETQGEISWRVARGLSITAEMNASRIRDQLSLPRRGATPEEILLELRELQSGYEYAFEFGFTYTFGSIFSAVVNPRFGQ
jgi:hypothetical protein